jgi:hypothetical protein
VKWKQQYFALSGGDGAKLECVESEQLRAQGKPTQLLRCMPRCRIYDDRSQFKQNETPVGTIPLVAPTSGNKLADVTEDKSTLIPNAFTLHSDVRHCRLPASTVLLCRTACMRYGRGGGASFHVTSACARAMHADRAAAA